jgi:hypothetical protein
MDIDATPWLVVHPNQFCDLAGLHSDHRSLTQKDLSQTATNQPFAGDSHHKMSVAAIGGFGSPRRLR